MHDAAMREAIERNLATEGLLAAARVEVQVQEGRVHLGGSVPSYAARCAATRVARRIAGLQNVFADVRVLPAAIGDEELTRRARCVIRWSALTPADGVTATVSNGVLTLDGCIGSACGRQALLAQLLPLAGVVALVDRITTGA